MLIDGVSLIEGSVIANASIAFGTTFPASPNSGEIYYRTDLSAMFVYNGVTWTPIVTGTVTQSYTVTGDVTGGISPTLSVLTLPAIATAGTYKSVSVNAKGQVTAGTNPTTLTGYGITDAQSYSADLTAIAALVGTSGLLRKTAGTYALDTNTYLTTGGGSITGDLTLVGNLTMTGSILPSANNVYSLGSASMTWKDVFVGPGSLYVNGKEVVTDVSNTMVFTTDLNQNLRVQTTGTGTLELQADTGTIAVKGTMTITTGKKVLDSAGIQVEFGDNIEMGLNRITGLGAPIGANDAVSKAYVDGLTGSDATIVRTSGDQTINGNKIFGGNITINGILTSNSSQVTFADNILEFNSHFTSGMPTENAGFQVRRGDLGIVQFIWDETNDRFTMVDGAGAYQNLWTSGTITAGTLVGALSGSATSAGHADTLTTGRTLSVSGDASGTSVAFDGSAPVSIPLTLATVNPNVGTFGSASTVPTIKVSEKGLTTAVTSTSIAIDASQVSTGALANARISQSSVTQHQGALSIAESQIPNAQILARVADNETITGSWTFSNPVSGVDPTATTHLATKSYVDAFASGTEHHPSVKAATTANITLSGLQTIDGYTTVAGDRVLVKDQTTGAQNGVYDASSGAWTRSFDFDNIPLANEVTGGEVVFVENGAVNANTSWILVTKAPITIGSTALVFTLFAKQSVILGGAGLVRNGDTIDVVTASTSRIVVNADSIDLALVTNSGTGSLVKVSIDAYGRVTGTTPVVGSDITGLGLTTTIGSTAIALGGTSTSLAGLTTLTATGAITGATFIATAGTGSSTVHYGTAVNTGYVEFIAPSGTRQGYIGYSTTNAGQDAGTIPFVMATAAFAGNITATTVTAATVGTHTGAVIGNADTATKLATAHTIALSGGVTGTATSFDGSANITIPVTSVAAASLSGIVPSGNLSGTYAISITGTASNSSSASTATTIAGGSYAQSTGLSTGWGVTNGTSTGAFNGLMGTTTSATWLLSGTSGGVFRGGFQLLDSGGGFRLYANANFIEFSGNVLQAAALTTTGNITAGSSATITSGTGGFTSATYLGNTRNPIWRFGNADGYGLSYFQGTSGANGGDSIGFHFGTSTSAGSAVQITPSGVLVGPNWVLHAGNFNSYAPALTGTGASGTWNISITGTAASATNSTGTYHQHQWTPNTDLNAFFTSTTAGDRDWSETSAGGPTGTWWFVENLRHTNATNAWGRQNAWGWEDNANEFYSRNVSVGTWGPWVRFLHSGNFNAYAPKNDGTGASGTWNINVTGNAATATSAGILTGPAHTNGSDGWFRSNGAAGWYNQDYAVGIYATEAGNIRTYNGANFISSGNLTAVGSIYSGGNIFLSNIGQGLVGIYDATKYQGVFSMGSAYALSANGTSPGNLYGIAWTHENAGGQSKAGLQHQALFMMNGITQTAVGAGIWSSGNITTTAQFNGSGAGLTGTASSLAVGTASFVSPMANSASGVKTGRSVWGTGLYTYGGISDPNAPYTYHAALGAGNGVAGSFELSANWYPNGTLPNGISYRTLRDTTDSWTSWSRLLDQNNFNSYAPTLAGTGATGTWGISITGSAATATTATNATYLYSTSHPGQYYISSAWDGTYWNVTSNHGAAVRVGRADTADGIAGITTGNLFRYEGFTLDANTMPGNRSGFTYSVNAPWTGPIQHFEGSGYGLQLNAQYGGGSNLSFRTRNGDNGTWNSWNTVLSSGNFTNYAPKTDGTGATGTWGISISGNSATTSQTTFSTLFSNSFVDVLAGEGNGFRFWSGSNSYKISMGVSAAYQYGPVSDYSIKTQIDAGGTSGRGFTWGHDGTAPIAALNASSGNFQTAGSIVAGGDVTAFSDARIKTNIEVIPNALSKVEAIRGVTYNRIDELDRPRSVGVIAQEVEVVMPEAVRETVDGTKTVAYGNLVGLLVEAIKELSSQNKALLARLEALETRK